MSLHYALRLAKTQLSVAWLRGHQYLPTSKLVAIGSVWLQMVFQGSELLTQYHSLKQFSRNLNTFSACCKIPIYQPPSTTLSAGLLDLGSNARKYTVKHVHTQENSDQPVHLCRQFTSFTRLSTASQALRGMDTLAGETTLSEMC